MMGESLPSGAYNPKKACLNVLTMLGGVVNAALVFWVVVVRGGRDDVFALGVSYVAWFASVAVLHATKERARRLGGAAFNSAADRHSAELFRFFGVKVKQVSGTGTALACGIRRRLTEEVGTSRLRIAERRAG